MKSIFWLLALLAQLAVAGVVFIWILAFLGFTDESKRSVSTNLFGKLLVIICVLLAASQVAIPLWVGWNYYFFPDYWKQLPIGLFLPLVYTLFSILLCWGLIYLFKVAGYRRAE